MRAATARHSRDPKSRTACDRCYQLKEKCVRTSTSADCARCDRLDLACSTIRPVRPAGRRPRRTASSDDRKRRQHAPSIEPCLEMLPGLPLEERELLTSLLYQPGSLDQYVTSPSFHAEQQQLLSSQLAAAWPLLKDAFVACALSTQRFQTGVTTKSEVTTIVPYITRAVETLRSLPIATSQDIALCHTLGGLLTFSVSTVIGVGVPDICRHCLGTTASFMEVGGSDAHAQCEDPWQSFLVLWETVDCLVHRKKPMHRMQTPSSSNIDCRLGLCLPLLPCYHDLCIISNTLLDATDTSILTGLEKQLDDIHCFAESWQPAGLDQLIGRFESSDNIHLLAQAKLYRLGALLLCHRLRFPFGQEDAQAEIWAKEIMMELEMSHQVTKKWLRFIALPFIIAAIEIRQGNLRLRTLELVDDCVDQHAPFLQRATKTFLSRIWHERDMHITSRWFDSVYKPCPVLDSINSTYLSWAEV